MFSFIGKLLSGGAVSAIEKVALEYIETDKESAEAKAVMIKTLDPNGAMRREISAFTSKMYGFYLLATVILIFLYSFDLGDKEAMAEAVSAMTDLFMPITTAWGAIVGASFGVNMTNSMKGK